MSDTIPGGWLDQDEVGEIRSVLRQRIGQLEKRARRARDLGVTFQAKGYEAARASQLDYAKMSDEQAACVKRALDAFEGIEHGARVEALPSPEEEAAQERAFSLAQFTALSDDALMAELGAALGHEITHAEAQNVRATAIALLDDGAGDAAAG